jgi:hypothetical protein
MNRWTLLALAAQVSLGGPALAADACGGPDAGSWIRPEVPVLAPACTTGPASATLLAGSGMRVFVDPATGELRAPDADEIAALGPVSRLASGRRVPSRIASLDGHTFSTLASDELDFAVATIRPDGTIAFGHAGGLEDAARVVRSGQPAAPAAVDER